MRRGDSAGILDAPACALAGMQVPCQLLSPGEIRPASLIRCAGEIRPASLMRLPGEGPAPAVRPTAPLAGNRFGPHTRCAQHLPSPAARQFPSRSRCCGEKINNKMSKFNKILNSILCTSKHDLELVTPFDFNTKFQTHPNNRIELEANYFPSRIWNLSPIQLHANFLCIQTQH
jgi:hypothetical protein